LRLKGRMESEKPGRCRSGRRTMRGGMKQRQANAQSKQQAAAQEAAAQKKAEEEMLREY
jgi:hypothetical protein